VQNNIVLATELQNPVHANSAEAGVIAGIQRCEGNRKRGKADFGGLARTSVAIFVDGIEDAQVGVVVGCVRMRRRNRGRGEDAQCSGDLFCCFCDVVEVGGGFRC
jgi:hypothetical protein